MEEIDRFGAWRDLQVRFETCHAPLELAGDLIALAPPGVTRHEQPVRGFAAAIGAK
jgi:hypothetical protein